MEGRKRNRMQGFDYSSEAIYFITICIKDEIHQFGKIQHGKTNLNEEGKIAEEQILWLKKQYSYFELHNFVIMPNHVHLLFGINGDFERRIINSVEIPVEFRTSHDLSLQSQPNIKSVSSLIGAFKTTVSKRIHEF